MSSIALSGGLLAGTSPAGATIPPTPASMNSVSTEAGTTVVIGSDGRPYGTGINDHGQLTGGVTLPLTTLTPLTGLPAGVRATAVVSGGFNVVVLGSNGKAYAAGSNLAHQISTGSTADITTLTEIPWLAGTSVESIDAYDNSIAAVLADGSIKAQGTNRSSRFADALTVPATLDALPSDELAAQISIGFNGTAVRTRTGKVYTRGSSSDGELASANDVFEAVWTLEDDMGAVTAMFVELDDNHLVVLGSDHKVYGSGLNTDGNIGTDGDHDLLAAIDNPTGGANLVAVSTGSTHTVAIGDDGRLYGIGSNQYAQLPDHPNGLYTSANTSWAPLASGLASDVTGISAGFRATILVDDDGVLLGSGDNVADVRGQVTDGQTNVPEYASIAMRLLSGQVITNTSVPKISGSAQFTKTLTADHGSWSPSVKEYAYQWKQNGLDIVGATSATYAPAAAYIGHTITVAVTAKRGRFADATATSVATVAVAKGPALVYTSSSKPKPSGTLSSGHTLKISRTTAQLLAGFNPDATTLTYRWYRGSSAISGATKSTYRLTSKDKGKKVSVRIYGALNSYTTGSILTAAVTIKK